VEPLAGEERNSPRASERLLEIPGLSQLDQEAAVIKAQSKSLDGGGGDAPGANLSETPQNQGLKAEEGIEASFSVNIDSQEETLKTAPMPSTPKETVNVETVKLVSLEETQEAELEPVKPATGGNLLQSNDRSAESLELAKSLSQPHSASTHETSAAGRPPAPPVVGRIVDKMVEVVQAGGPQERHEISIQLNPPSLGKVQLTVLVEDSKLHVALFTTTSEARELVESNASQLRAALNEQGLMLEQFSVGVRSELAHNMPNQEWLGWQESFASGRFFQAPGAFSQEPAAEPRAYQRSSADSRIDLFI
jgi:flagellar hook-length control protein FliK